MSEEYIKILEESNKTIIEKKEELENRIIKAIMYIENDLKSFIYSAEYKTLLNILKGSE